MALLLKNGILESEEGGTKWKQGMTIVEKKRM